jgi:diaminopimelate epimerase
MNETTRLITAAGGNGTAIKVLDQPLTRSEYATRGKILGEEMEHYGAEQAGFLIPSHHHFEMAGGEFCGNASRAAAVLFSEIETQPKVAFTVSGFKGTVNSIVTKKSHGLYDVQCEFPGLPTNVQQTTLDNGQQASVVDLGGIVHVVIEGGFPREAQAYQEAHRDMMERFNLKDREAVGVIWFTRDQGGVTIHPVVWVKAVDTFFYEESCGSGTIATSRVTGVSDIVQPTGKMIQAEITNNKVILKSEMEVVR